MYLSPDNRARYALALQRKLSGSALPALHALAQARLFRVFVLIAALGVAVFSIYHRFQPQTASLCTTDFYSYYRSALRLGQGVSPYTGLASWIREHVTTGSAAGPYTDASCAAGTILEYSYTPLLGYILLPFTWLPFNAALALWDTCNLLFLGAAIYAFLRAARMSPSLSWLLVLTGVAMLVSPLRFDLYYAQIDVFLLCAACMALWARATGHVVLAGLLLALACAIEPTLLIIVGFLLWKREMKLAAITVSGSAALILTPFLWLGGKALQDMLLIWRFYGGQYAVLFTNDAPRGVLLRLFSAPPYVPPLTTIPGAATLLWLLTAAVVVSLTLTRLSTRPLDREIRSFLEIGLAVAASLLISPWSENSQFTWLMVPFLAVYVSVRRIGIATSQGRKLLIGFAVALLFLFFIGDDVQLALLAHASGNSRIAPLFLILAATYLYSLFAIAGVSLYAQHVLAHSATDTAGMAGTSGRFQDSHRWTQVKRVHIIGGPGSGKTTLSHALAGLLAVPPCELDEIAGAGVAPRFRMERPLTRRLADIDQIVSSPGWITEGSYLWWTDGLLRSADVIVWLDIPFHVALRRIVARHVREYLGDIRRQREPRSLLAAARHPHLPHLFTFVRYTWAYQHRTTDDPRPQAEWLDDGWSLTRAATERELAAYPDKVVRCAHPVAITHLLESIKTALSAQLVEASR